MENNNNEPVHTGTHPPIDTEWMSVDEAHVYLMNNGLSRSKKTIRKRCSNGSFDEVRSKDTPNGFRYMVSKRSLDTYVEEEKSYETNAVSETNDENSEQMHTGTHMSEHEHTGANTFEPVHTSEEEQADEKNDDEEIKKYEKLIEELEEKNETLKRELIEAEIEKRAAHQARDQIKNLSEKIIEDLQKTNYRLGGAESQLRQLQPPTQENRGGDNQYEQNNVYTVQ